MSHTIPARLALVLLLAVCHDGVALAQAPPPPSAGRQASPATDPGADELTVPVIPERRLGEAPLAPLPALPPGADRVRPLTLDVRLTTRAGGRVHTRRQTVTRAVDRVHIAAANGDEWLFEQNPVDPRRVSAAVAHHASKAIVVYSESDLRTMLGIPGWAHVLTMGVDAATLAGATSPSAPRTMNGIAFRRLRTAALPARAVVWWNAEHLLPLEHVSADGVSSLRLAGISPVTDAARLRPLEHRFPAYRVVELADWLEEH